MTLLAPSAPLLTVRHEWSVPVEQEPTFPARVLTAEDGTEQRLGLSHLATTRVTYRLLAPTYGEAAQLKTLLENATDALVRVPRWEDEARIPDGSAVSAGDVTIPCDPSDKPTFVSGSEVLLWRSATSYEVATIDTVAGSSIDVVSPLANGWAAGTIVVPIAEARVVLPIALTHWVPTSGALTIAFDVGLRDLAGLGSGGTAVTTTVASLTLYRRSMSSVPTIYGDSHAIVAAIATDAAGDPVVNVPIVWSSSDPDLAVWATGDPMVAVVHGQRSAVGFNTVTITATVGAVTATATFTVWQ